MELHEEIRLGAKKVPSQSIGDLMSVDPTGRVFATCAQGAAMDAAGVLRAYMLASWRSQDAIFQKWSDARPILWTRVTCQHCSSRPTWSLQMQIVHLNDHHFWTRERIADYVEAETVKLRGMPTEMVEA